uniref:Ig-like domain-containing protein n=1 Tax=Labrus bergylta TaxID=56723 RepID=A0A3Q3M8C5_9LABR
VPAAAGSRLSPPPPPPPLNPPVHSMGLLLHMSMALHSLLQSNLDQSSCRFRIRLNVVNAADSVCVTCFSFKDEEQVVKPVVSVYPAASRGRLEEKSSLLCLASAMFPPVVRISWRRQTESGCLEELPSADGQQLELRESGCTASVLQIYQTKFSYEYSCYVQHEGGTVEALIDTECRPQRNSN